MVYSLTIKIHGQFQIFFSNFENGMVNFKDFVQMPGRSLLTGGEVSLGTIS
jgi:hypothetical protein